MSSQSSKAEAARAPALGRAKSHALLRPSVTMLDEPVIRAKSLKQWKSVEDLSKVGGLKSKKATAEAAEATSPFPTIQEPLSTFDSHDSYEERPRTLSDRLRMKKAHLTIMIPKLLTKRKKAEGEELVISPMPLLTPGDQPMSRFSPDSEGPFSVRWHLHI